MRLIKNICIMVFVMSVLFISCNSSQQELQLNPYELSIKIPKSFSHRGYRKVVIYKDKFIGYNFSGRCFDIYDLTKKEAQNQIKLDSTLFSYSNGNCSFKVVEDTFYLEGIKKELYLMDFNGNLIKKKFLANSNVDLEDCIPFPTMKIKEIPLALSNSKNLYTNLYVSGINKKSKSSFFKYNIESQKSSLIDNSVLNINLDGYGFMAYPEITITDSEKIIFSWIYTDTVYILDNGQYEKKVLNSNVFKGTINPHSEESLKSFCAFIKEAYRYENLVYIESLGYYARIIHSKKRESQYDTSNQYLCIFNSVGKELASYRLDENIMPFLMVWENQLVLQLEMDKDNKELLKFLCFPVPESNNQ